MLDRGIRKWDLVLLTINSIVGAGIFGLPSKLFALSGPYSLLAFFCCALIAIIFILCFAEVSAQFDKTGGPYTYAVFSFGRTAAFGMGWLVSLGRWFNYATLINLLVTYLAHFFPSISSTWPRAGFIIGLSAFFTFINYIGLKNSTRLTNIFTIAKLVPLLLFVVIGLLFIKPAAFTPVEPFSFPDFSTCVLLLVFAFGGYESVLINSGEIRNPRKNLPFALILSTIFVAILYCLIQAVCIGTLPGLAGSDRPLSDAANAFAGPIGATVIAAGAAVSIFATLNGIMLGGSRMPFALSQEKQFPKIFSFVHPKFQTPTWSLLLFAVVGTGISLFWGFLAALTIGTIIRVLIYLVVCFSLLKLRRIRKKEEMPFRAPFGRALAIAAVFISGWLLLSSKWTELRDVAICIAAGFFIYGTFLFFRKTD